MLAVLIYILQPEATRKEEYVSVGNTRGKGESVQHLNASQLIGEATDPDSGLDPSQIFAEVEAVVGKTSVYAVREQVTAIVQVLELYTAS